MPTLINKAVARQEKHWRIAKIRIEKFIVLFHGIILNVYTTRYTCVEDSTGSKEASTGSEDSKVQMTEDSIRFLVQIVGDNMKCTFFI